MFRVSKVQTRRHGWYRSCPRQFPNVSSLFRSLLVAPTARPAREVDFSLALAIPSPDRETCVHFHSCLQYSRSRKNFCKKKTRLHRVSFSVEDRLSLAAWSHTFPYILETKDKQEDDDDRANNWSDGICHCRDRLLK